jgi:hypothetical protein
VEFNHNAATNQLIAPVGSPASDRVDLLTTVIHELGHVLGFDHTDTDSPMNASLPLGMRRPPAESSDHSSEEDIAIALAGSAVFKGSDSSYVIATNDLRVAPKQQPIIVDPDPRWVAGVKKYFVAVTANLRAADEAFFEPLGSRFENHQANEPQSLMIDFLLDDLFDV